MPFVWLVECKTCLQRFAVKRRELVSGKPGAPALGQKSTAALVRGKDGGSFECPHCHESHRYSTDDYIPGEGRIVH